MDLIFASLEFIEDEGFVFYWWFCRRREKELQFGREREGSESDLIRSGIGNILEFKWAH